MHCHDPMHELDDLSLGRLPFQSDTLQALQALQALLVAETRPLENGSKSET